MAEYYCEKCQKIVPENETRGIFNSDYRYHVYSEWKNSYLNQSPGTIGCRLELRETICGKIVEPTDQEYFISNLTGS